MHHLAFKKRCQRQLHRGRIAPRIGNHAGRLDLFTVQFGQTIGHFLLQVLCGVVRAIPFLVGRRIKQAEVC